MIVLWYHVQLKIQVAFTDLKVPMPADTVDLMTIFKGIRDLHVSSEEVPTYKFSPEALDAFGIMHDDLQAQKAASNDENRCGHLIKGITHLVRLAGILFVLEQGFAAVSNGILLQQQLGIYNQC